MTTNTTVSYITTVGQNLLTQTLGGSTLKITGAAFGSDLITNTSQTYLESLQNVISNGAASAVYTASSSQIQYTYIASNTIQFRVILGTDVGGFTIGNWGLLDSNGNLISITALGTAEVKTATSTGSAGDNRVFSINITMSADLINNLDLSVVSLGAAALPELNAETALPSTSTAAYPVFHVISYSNTNAPALASRTQSSWYYYLPYSTLQNLFVNQTAPSSTNGVSYSITSLGWGDFTYSGTTNGVMFTQDSGGNLRHIPDISWILTYCLTQAKAATLYTPLSTYNANVNQPVLTTSTPTFSWVNAKGISFTNGGTSSIYQDSGTGDIVVHTNNGTDHYTSFYADGSCNFAGPVTCTGMTINGGLTVNGDISSTGDISTTGDASCAGSLTTKTALYTDVIRNLSGSILMDTDVNISGILRLTNSPTVGDYSNRAASTAFTEQSIVNGSGLSRSNNIPGYTTLPGGWILQAGIAASGSDGFTNVTFPVAFPNTCIAILATEQNASGAWASSASPTIYGSYSVGKTNGWVYGMKWQTSSWVGVQGIEFGYIAIGY